MIREAWFCEHIIKNMFELDKILITKKATMEYKHEVLPFQKVKATLNTENIKKASFNLTINFYSIDGSTTIGIGKQTIVFANKSRKITRIPNEILEKISSFSK